MKKKTIAVITVISCFATLAGLSACAPETMQQTQDFFNNIPIFSDLRGYIPKVSPSPPAPAPAPVEVPAPAPAPVAPAPTPPLQDKAAEKDIKNDGMIIPDIRPLPPPRKLRHHVHQDLLDGS